MAHASYTEQALGDFRRVQRLAYDAALEVAAQLSPGVTERQAAGRLEQACARRGVQRYFHRPFAWFGPRAMFAKMKTPLGFFPTDKALEPGMGGILDVAPILDGVAVDIGYTFGDSSQLRSQRTDLLLLRTLILDQVRAERSMAEVYLAVDRLISELGYVNCHRRYPFSVLAHKVNRVDTIPLVDDRTLFGFGLPSAIPLLGRAFAARVSGSRLGAPFWNGSAKQRAQPGLWAVEPHIGRDGVGSKWEELLVVTESTAYWLDDDLPHVNGSPGDVAHG